MTLRLFVGVLAGGMLCASLATASSAGVLTGVVSPCAQQLTRPFAPWGDYANYAFVSNGGFESGATGWTLGGTAKVVPGNESFFVHGSRDGASLALPPGSSATTPSTCVGTLSPTLRLFASNTGDPASTLRIDVLYTDALGLRWTVPVAAIPGSASWQPTPTTLLLANVTALPLLSGSGAQVALRFTPQGAGGGWQIDDVYVDPFKQT